jgi:hypothetical protein
MGRNSSGNGASFANRASRDFVGTGSMTSRSPSLRIMASSPGNSNSRGIRTALFRPFLKTLTWRSGLALAGICRAYAKEPCLSTPEIIRSCFLPPPTRVTPAQSEAEGFASGVCELTCDVFRYHCICGLGRLKTSYACFRQSGRSHFPTFNCYRRRAKLLVGISLRRPHPKFRNEREI